MRHRLKRSVFNLSVLIIIFKFHFIQAAVKYSNLNNTLQIYNQKEQFIFSEDVFLSTPDLINKYGYPVETYEDIVTKDGYYLTLHRIPYGINSGPSNNKPVVYVQPGFVSNSIDAVLAGPNIGLGYYLADKGYDVWIGNTRGSRYCTKHKTTTRNSRKYWDYTFSDIGNHDIPAMIDYILNATKEKKLFYIGHSRGTSSFFVMCSKKPEYNKKIRAMAAMAPVTYMNHIPNPLFHLVAHNIPLIKSLLDAFNMYYISINHFQLLELCKSSYRSKLIEPDLCTILVFSLGGFDYENFNVSMVPLFLGHFPDDFSIKEIMHFGQAVLSGKFRDFNYGSTVNLRKYNQIEPPDFDLSKVKAPVAVLYSANDLQSSAIDAERLSNELGNLVGKFFIQEGPNHFSYFNGMNARSTIYDKILDVFSNY